MTAHGRFSDVSQSVPSIWAQRENIGTGDVFRWCFDYGTHEWDTVTVMAACDGKLMVQREQAGVLVEIPTPRRVEVIGGSKLNAALKNPALTTPTATSARWSGTKLGMWLNDDRPTLYPGALPDGTGEVLQHLVDNHGVPSWKTMSHQQLAAFGALVRAGYIKRAAYYQYR